MKERLCWKFNLATAVLRIANFLDYLLCYIRYTNKGQQHIHFHVIYASDVKSHKKSIIRVMNSLFYFPTDTFNLK
jgi:hypothetical protein